MPETWSQSAAALLDALDSDRDQGLTQAQARRRLKAHGANRLRRARRRRTFAILVDQAKSVVFGLLFLAALLSVAIGEGVQAIAIAVAIVINVAIGFVTELRATRSMEALRALDRATARVRRGGKTREVDAAALVPGDIVHLAAGEVVPADLRLLEADALAIDESALTGESVPVTKQTGSLAGAPPLAERTNMVHKGTAVSNGSGLGLVTATGMDTEIGRVAALAQTAEAAHTPLEKRLDALGRRLLLAILAVAAMVSLVGIAAGRDALLMVETGVALVVAAVPEGLPIVASVALARGMWRLARRDALVERLSAVETLGATNVICTDKTGTLTENRMRVGRLVLADGPVDMGVHGAEREGSPVTPDDAPTLAALLEAVALCNDARLGTPDADPAGDPTEIALLAAARAAGIERAALVEGRPEIAREAFDPDTKMMATVHRDEAGVVVAVKGAPEAVLDAATRVMTPDGDTQPLDASARQAWAAATERLAEAGLRTLAVARRMAPEAPTAPYRELTLVGLVGLVDPPRAGVREAVLNCRRAGIHAVMVTGDAPSTARAIAAEVGLVDDAATARVVHGRDLADLDRENLEARDDLRGVAIFARFTPEQKLDLIEFYQRAGLVVAMTGDGVNDAPALKKADIGVAMGQRGTQVAREAADMVLRDDSFASIVNAIAGGRRIFGNIRKFVVYMLSGNIAEILAVSVLALVNAPLPLLPLQILFINIVSDVFPALALGLGEKGDTVMRRPPRDPGEPLLTRRLWGTIGGYGVLLATSVMAAFAAAFALGMGAEAAVTVSFLTFGFARLWHVFNMRDAAAGLVRNEVTLNPWVWGALAIGVALLLAAAYMPGLAQVLDTVPPGPESWALIAAGSLAPLVVGQALKLIGK
ncbi:cation-translocating P-type ATPase [Roseovarius salinarum]|uniref:cation-translocating P-type ATPase n=1 Tax=Roseovarius salinarum TaxID=1981892 RepID=UPI000C326E18|nr:cation-transporting P-type ATPase [Roseovarius salinarum]